MSNPDLTEMPTIFASSYTSNTVGGNDGKADADVDLALANWNPPMPDVGARDLLRQAAAQYQYKTFDPDKSDPMACRPLSKKTQKETTVSTLRVVKVYIADPNEDLPLENRMLYTGSEKLTDLTDQELFFEVPIIDLLLNHNAVRAKTVNKARSGGTGLYIFLEPARIRDLKMSVVTVATF